ncbi:Tyrosine-protein kinase, catalytic domain [Phytophthora cactorum]|nr:Tyrosine-protein kinase, catalytic domain [Phytophthora cactorum]
MRERVAKFQPTSAKRIEVYYMSILHLIHSIIGQKSTQNLHFRPIVSPFQQNNSVPHPQISAMSPLAALLMLLVSATLQTASSIDVPVDTNFEFTGLHSDFAQQYYVLNTELDDTAQLSDVSGDALPSALRQQLSSNSLSWGDLPGLLQRAFLWDAGYVLTPTHTLAKVYTRCGRSMTELVVPPKAFERAGCQLRECVLPDGMIFHRSLNCKALQLSRAVQCAVDAAEDMSAPAYAAVWGDGGEADTLPEVTVQRHAYADTDGKPNLIFALHTTDFEVAYTQCPLTPAMVIPCAPYNLVNQSKFCSPEPGEVASAWLTKYAADHKQDKTWLLVPLCIVTFVTFGTVAVYRYKSALRDEARREVDLFMRENRHLFDNGAVEAFLVPKRKGKGRSRSSHTTGTGRQHRSSSYSSSSSLDSDDSAYSSRASIRDSETSLSYDEGIQNAAAFEHFDATIGLSASAFDPLASNTRMNPLQSDTETPLQDVESKDSTPDDATARKNEMAIRSFRLFESHRKIRRLRIQWANCNCSDRSLEALLVKFGSLFTVALKQLVPEKRRLLHEMEMFLAEIYLMAQLKHPHIVALNGIAWNTLEHVVMVQEYMEGGDLQHFLAQQRVNNTTPTAPISSGNTIVKRSSSISGGLPQVDEAVAVAAASSGSFAGGLIYSIHSSHFTWSKQKLAIAQARLVQHPLRLMRRIIDGGLRPQLSSDCPLPITHLIAACVSRNPKLRPSAADVGAWLASARGERLLRKSSSVLIS